MFLSFSKNGKQACLFVNKGASDGEEVRGAGAGSGGVLEITVTTAGLTLLEMETSRSSGQWGGGMWTGSSWLPF